jgi:hypothetical protein
MKAKLTYRNLVPAAEQALKILLFLAGDRSGKKSTAEICSFRNQSVGRVHTDPQPRQPNWTYTWIGRRRGDVGRIASQCEILPPRRHSLYDTLFLRR